MDESFKILKLRADAKALAADLAAYFEEQIEKLSAELPAQAFLIQDSVTNNSGPAQKKITLSSLASDILVWFADLTPPRQMSRSTILTKSGKNHSRAKDLAAFAELVTQGLLQEASSKPQKWTVSDLGLKERPKQRLC